MTRFLASLLGLLAATAFLIGVATNSHSLRIWSKPLPVLLMALVVFVSTTHRYGRWIGCGLLACLLGDVLLEWSPATFLHGVGAFFVGHVLYIVAYLKRSRALRPLVLVLFAFWGLAVVIGLRSGLEAQGMLIPVAVYSVAISVMMWRAAACWETGGASAVTLLAFAGAVLFAVSDTMIAVDRFHQPFVGARYAIIVLYWLGQLGITLSALRLRQQRPQIPA